MVARSRAWFERHPLAVAFDLLGMEFIVERDDAMVSGRIVEVEAYGGPGDLASHAAMLKAGKAALYGEAGRLYVYRSYGIHTMLNIVAHESREAGAVLIRALEPSENVEFMRARRSTLDLRKLTTGPGVLSRALALQLADNGYDLIDGSVIRLNDGPSPDRILAGPRIGISRSIDHPWRLFDEDSKFVSSHRRGVSVERSSLFYDAEQ